MALGNTNAEIGRDLYLSEATVKAELTRIMTRPNVCNRARLAVLGTGKGCPPQWSQTTAAGNLFLC
ncbi:LuxR C-terminal-related transcriptional regulator [Arthrobacter sp. LAPM80]|uniref:LuxR C-terminal-related transcriptional regulator n=1 Tax=Arthrobacter sp. LAPM80 TaxID=3141788 RepID=UPI00398B9CD1